MKKVKKEISRATSFYGDTNNIHDILYEKYHKIWGKCVIFELNK
jgi:hypothetical protein